MLKKIGIIYIIIITVAFVLLCLFKFHSNNNINWSTNNVDLTNYVYKNIPHYIDIYNFINNTNEIFISNTNGTVISNINLTMTSNNYSDLLTVIFDDSNYINTDIVGKYSNGFIILSHYKTTNIIKLPNLQDVKLNIIIAGIDLKGYHILYERSLIQNFNIPIINKEIDAGAGALFQIGSITTNLGANVFINF